MPEEDFICQIEVLDRALPGQVSSSVHFSSSGLTTHGLQLRKVISLSFKLRFGCSWTLWKAHRVKNTFICLRRILDVRSRCYIQLAQVRSARQFRSARVGCIRMTSNFGRSYLLRLNSDLGVLGLYGKPIISRIHSYAYGGY